MFHSFILFFTNQMFIQFDFSDYIRRLYLLGNVTLTDDDIVVINKIDAIRSISSIIAQQSPETLQRYIVVHFLKSQSFHLPKIFRTISENQKGTTSGVLDAEPRTIGCARYVNKNMEFAVSKLYIDKYYDKLARDEVCIIELYFITICSIDLQSIEMVDNIRNAFIDMVNQSMWMDTVSKKNTIEKVSDRIIIFALRKKCTFIQAQAILAKVGYPEYLDNKYLTKLESIYAKVRYKHVVSLQISHFLFGIVVIKVCLQLFAYAKYAAFTSIECKKKFSMIS